MQPLKVYTVLMPTYVYICNVKQAIYKCSCIYKNELVMEQHVHNAISELLV